jgi:hypothetical protein
MFTVVVRLFNGLLNMTRSPLIPLGELLQLEVFETTNDNIIECIP